MPRVVERPWFGPRRLPNWGWSPITWQGWVVTAVFLAATLACAFLIPDVATKFITEVILVALLIAVCALTGTRPGAR
jgi:hypothetical protein